MAQTDPSSDPTRERLLDEAEKLFADKGFEASSVREITAAADAHLSAVNYHFSSKRGLYVAVFKERWLPRAQRVTDGVTQLLGEGEPTPERVVRAMADVFISGFGDEEERIRHQQLIHREMNHPTEVFNMILEEATLPAFRSMIRMLRPWMPPGTSDLTIMMHVFSIFAHLLYFNFGRRMVSAVTGREYDDDFRRQIVDHITRFCMAGLKEAPS